LEQWKNQLTLLNMPPFERNCGRLGEMPVYLNVTWQHVSRFHTVGLQKWNLANAGLISLNFVGLCQLVGLIHLSNLSDCSVIGIHCGQKITPRIGVLSHDGEKS
jgi:hypothetical protein